MKIIYTITTTDMKIKTILSCVAIMLTACFAQAQTTELEGLSPLTLEYAGFEFHVPAGAMVQKDSRMTVTYPNMKFGISMVNQSVRGSNQKRAFEMCQRSAADFHLRDAKVEKINVDGAKGAKATGYSEGMDVTILILPTNDNELTMVIMAEPGKEELTKSVINSMKR